MALRAIAADRLAVALHRFEPGDDLRAKDQADCQRGVKRSARAKSDVTEQVQRVKLFGERCQKKIKHVIMFRRASLANAVARGCWSRGDREKS